MSTGTWAVVLAAGSSHRFGGGKLTSTFRGRPLASHVATTFAEALASGILGGGVAVIPAGDTALAWMFDTAGLRLVENPGAATGLAGSVQRGLAALAGEPAAGAALMVLADQPLLRLEVVARLVAEWRGGAAVVRPRYADDPAPGHPVLLARALWPHASALRGDQGFSSLLGGALGEVREVPVPGGNPDVDTPADLARLEATGG